MKILYISNWKDNTGWGDSAKHYILALDAADVEVVPRHLNMSPKKTLPEIPPRLLELEQNDDSNCDVCIQHVLPPFMERGKFDLNVGLFFYETSDFKHTQWQDHLNMLDLIIVPNKKMVRICKNSGVDTKVEVVPIPCNPSIYSQYYKKLAIPELQDTFVFYTVCEVNRRKNLAGLLKAFHLEFHPHELVSLLIKPYCPGLSPEQAGQKISALCHGVKQGLRLYRDEQSYKQEVILSAWLTQDELMSLHKTCNCFVAPSYGEAWCLPGFDAVAMGNVAIMTDEGGPADYIQNGENGLLIPWHSEPAFMEPSEVPYPDIWCGRETWCSPDITQLRVAMRTAFEDSVSRQRIGEAGIDTSYKYSYKKVGDAMAQILKDKV